MADEFTASENGSIKISEEVIVRISSISAKEVEGVAELYGSGTAISELLGKKNQNKPKGVKVEMGENTTEIDIHIVVRFGYKIGEVARKVQESVRFALESYAGVSNAMVNVFVDAVDMGKPAAAVDILDDADESADSESTTN